MKRLTLQRRHALRQAARRRGIAVEDVLAAVVSIGFGRAAFEGVARVDSARVGRDAGEGACSVDDDIDHRTASVAQHDLIAGVVQR
jgi:hypothetical protein